MMSFVRALRYAMAGDNITRAGWAEPRPAISVEWHDTPDMLPELRAFVGADPKGTRWLGTQEDLAASDWVLVS